jgi:hypothetical protein
MKNRPYLLAALLFSLSIPALPQAQELRRLVIPAQDGYDFDACQKNSGQCAQIIADAWCDAKGFGKAVGFEHMDQYETTASLIQMNQSTRRPALVITCSH